MPSGPAHALLPTAYGPVNSPPLVSSRRVFNPARPVVLLPTACCFLPTDFLPPRSAPGTRSLRQSAELHERMSEYG